MNKSLELSGVWLWLTAPIAVLLLVAAGAGVFIEGLYHDAPSFAAQARGQDLVSLVVVLPLLIVAAVLARRGSARARLIWLGAMIYLVYCYALAAFDVKFNPLFLVYVALLGCSLYGLIGGLATLDMAAVKARFTDRTPAKAVSIYLVVLAFLFYMLWLKETVPATLTGRVPQSVIDEGIPTNGVHVLDMAWILPALVIAAVSLWRKRALGYVLAGATLAYVALLVLAILSMVAFMVMDGHAVAAPQVAIFGMVLAASVGALAWFLSCLGRGSPVTGLPSAGATER